MLCHEAVLVAGFIVIEWRSQLCLAMKVWVVKLLGGPHSSKGSRLIGDAMFFEGASVEVQSVMFGREAAWRPRYQCCVLTALQVMLVNPEFAWLMWRTSFSGTVRAAFVLL